MNQTMEPGFNTFWTAPRGITMRPDCRHGPKSASWSITDQSGNEYQVGSVVIDPGCTVRSDAPWTVEIYGLLEVRDDVAYVRVLTEKA